MLFSGNCFSLAVSFQTHTHIYTSSSLTLAVICCTWNFCIVDPPKTLSCSEGYSIILYLSGFLNAKCRDDSISFPWWYIHYSGFILLSLSNICYIWSISSFFPCPFCSEQLLVRMDLPSKSEYLLEISELYH